MKSHDRDRLAAVLGVNAEDLEARMQDYVEGTLEHKQALHLHLRSVSDPVLAAELDATRSFFAALDGLPRAEPSTDFDARVLASVPLGHYASAPRRALPVLVIGDLAPAAWWVALRRAGHGAIAAVAAYFLVLVIANSTLQSGISKVAGSIDRALADAVERTASSAALSPLVGAVARGYDALTSAGAHVATAMGPALAVFVVGALLGMVALATLAARQRKQLGASSSR